MATAPETLAGTELVFVDDHAPGITRRRAGKGWCYYDSEGRRIADRGEIARLNAIGLPPAYERAWYCPHPHGHLLATGFDARGRKQYRYHEAFRASRDCEKYDGLARFGTLLPRVRKRVEHDMALPGLTRERAIACVVRLLDTGAIRVGNAAYAKENKSFGATTLRMRHAEVRQGVLRLRFRAKSGKDCRLRVTDRSLIRFVRAMQDLPGQNLFQFVGEDGQPCPVGSADVNAWLRETMGEAFTAKHFRTWTASAAAFAMLADARDAVRLPDLVRHVSERLNNTPAIARKSYIHPALLALAADAADQAEFRAGLRLPRRTPWLSRHERGLVQYLERLPETSALLAA